MLTLDDVRWPPQKPKDAIIALAFGIDGEIVHTLVTYENFYELITTSASIVCKSENCDTVDFVNEFGCITNTLQADPLLCSVLASSPEIFVLLRRSKDNLQIVEPGKHPWYGRVEPGWKYDESGILPL